MSESCALPFVIGPVDAVVSVPGSKSITNRALPIAALASGETDLRGALFSDDSRHFVENLRRLGYRVTDDEANRRFVLTGQGTEPLLAEREVDLFVGNSGTTARFITAMVALGRGQYHIDGVARMRQRPIGDLVSALHGLGADIEDIEQTGCPPIRVTGRGLRGGAVTVRGQDSSQFLTALLLAAPYADAPVCIDVDGKLVSRPYVEMTVSMMAQFGVHVETDWTRFVVAPGRYQGRVYDVEPDASGATYFLALAAAQGGRVTIRGLHLTSLQGDAQFVRVLEQMGCVVETGEQGLTLLGPPDGVLRGCDVDLFDMSDTMPTLAALAPLAAEPVHIRNVANVRVKETDRIAACVQELRRFGVTVDERPDGLTVHPCQSLAQNVRVQTYDDHRMAMSFSILGLRAKGTVISDPGCVNKTFPDFFERLGEALHKPFSNW
ncbi:MAG: 3-phosphoshikimate 1-carboxyvinyltransferase [Firmicutes bacterium]|nr:3-phosphoshikimate 1-carboxyvinyltransferase [Bacillota bacterium]